MLWKQEAAIPEWVIKVVSINLGTEPNSWSNSRQKTVWRIFSFNKPKVLSCQRTQSLVYNIKQFTTIHVSERVTYGGGRGRSRHACWAEQLCTPVTLGWARYATPRYAAGVTSSGWLSDIGYVIYNRSLFCLLHCFRKQPSEPPRAAFVQHANSASERFDLRFDPSKPSITTVIKRLTTMIYKRKLKP